MNNNFEKKKVSLVKGEDRYTNVREALEMIADEIVLGEKIVIKPNFTSVKKQLASTHIDAVRATLDFISTRTSAQITIAEGSGTGTSNSIAGFRNYDYLCLQDNYNVQFVDLNRDEVVRTNVLDEKFNPIQVKVAKTVVESDCRISISPPKTHDSVLYSGALKNLLMGSVVRREPWIIARINNVGSLFIKNVPPKVPGWLAWISRNDKMRMHQGYKALNLNLFKLATLIPPHISIIDGFEGMDGDGPVFGNRVQFGIGLASLDFLACDTVAAWLMGFDISQIGYLAYCHMMNLGAGDLSEIEVIGERLEECMVSFKPHHLWQEQLNWKTDDPERFLVWLTTMK